jgi:HSP20 family molecular chaperone IbpA
LALPAGVEAEKVAAEFRDGVLTITPPKSEKALPRKISVKG